MVAGSANFGSSRGVLLDFLVKEATTTFLSHFPVPPLFPRSPFLFHCHTETNIRSTALK